MPGDFEKQQKGTSEKSTQTVGGIRALWSAYVATDFFSDEGTLVGHLGNETTWHIWLGLSNATSWLGIAVAQMSRVSKAVQPDHYRMLHHAACICQAISVVILLIGTYRFFREQSAINGTGKRASQWTLLATGILVFILVCSFLVMLIVANTDIIQ